MKLFKQFTASFALVSLMMLLIMPTKAHADVNQFTINDFSADYSLNRDKKQGSMRVIETIKLTYSDNNHGILRALPNTYKNQSLNIHNIAVSSPTGASSEFTTYEQNDNTVLKIGDPNRTITGNQVYEIRYTVDNVIGFYDEYDELYWDINGNQWQQPFTRVSVTLRLPNGLKLGGPEALCFAGSFGAGTQDCTISKSKNTIDVDTTKVLGPNQTLTIIAGFEKGYFQQLTLTDKLRDYAPQLAVGIALPLIIFVVCFSRWRRLGRDDRSRGVVVAQYDAPPGLRPLEVGSILDFETDNKDISATLIDLAVRKYIKIIEKREDKLIGKDKITYSLQLANNNFSELTPIEAAILSGLFKQFAIGEEIDLQTKARSLHEVAEKARTEIAENLTKSGYFKQNPSQAGGKILGIAIVSGIALFMIGQFIGPIGVISAIVSIGIMIGFAINMPARTLKGVTALEHIKGLKLFLQVTEAERFKKLQGPSAAYANAGPEPTRTVDLFEKLLPYAMVLGVEKEWAGQFTRLYEMAPSWYQGDTNAFTAGYLISSLGNGFNASVNSAFASPASSNSSGLSGGGGFSGGGGGGGGGGGW